MNLRAASCAFLLASLATASHAQPVKRVRCPALSPDGRVLAFGYQGDLWTVPSAGGRATRLTVHPALDCEPLFTPDGRQIVFSSNRYGSSDLFVMPAEGGAARRLTFHSGPESPSAVTPDGKWVVFQGSAYGMQDLYKVPLAGGEPIRLTWDSMERKYYGAVSPDGKWVAYDHGAYASQWRRRGYEGSNNADIWLARFETPLGAPKRLTTNPGHDFRPLFSRDGKTLYYVSDRAGKVNLWSMDLEGGAQKPLTRFETDGVRFPTYAPGAEKIAFEYDSEIWLLDLASGKSAPVPIDVETDERKNPVSELTVTSKPSEYAVSPDGKKVALIVRGDLFVVPAAGGTARKLVGRPSRESRVSWAPDSQSVVFSTDVNGQQDLHRIDLQGRNEQVLAAGPEDETYGRLSPDGRLVACHRGDRALVVLPVTGGDPVAVIPGNFLDVTVVGTPRFDWSPDSKWLVFAQSGDRLEEGVWVSAVSDPKPQRLTPALREVKTPHWSANGKLVYFAAAAVDVKSLYAVDVSGEPKPEFEEDALDRLDAPATRPGELEVEVDLANVERRLRRITEGGEVMDARLSSGGRTFFVETARGISTVSASAKSAELSSLIEQSESLQLPADGRRVYFLSGGKVQSWGVEERDRKTTEFTAAVTVDQLAENRQVFNEAWWLMDRFFYDEKLAGVDWKQVRAKYEKLLPYAPGKTEFYDLLAEMVFEIGRSHLGVLPPDDYVADTPSATGFLGIEPDWPLLETTGQFRVQSVLWGSPADSRWSKVNPGDYLLAVDGQMLGKELALDQLLDRKAGKKVVLTLNSQPSMAGSREIAIQPSAPMTAMDYRYEDWVRSRRELVHRLSGGKVAYLHVRRMDPAGEIRFKEELTSEAAGHEAMIVDVRYNPGGWVAHTLLDLLRRKPYLTFRPRALGKEVASDWFGEFTWGKPAALVINQDSASNAEMMAEGFRALGLGPVVGTPTFGAVIATDVWKCLDGGGIRVPMVGIHTPAGEDLELKGRQPDLPAPYDPVALREGRDPQLEAAVKAVLSRPAAPAKKM